MYIRLLLARNLSTLLTGTARSKGGALREERDAVREPARTVNTVLILPRAESCVH